VLPSFRGIGQCAVFVALACCFGFAAPSITSLSPTAAPVGGSVTINGSGFGTTQNGSYVTFGTIKATSVPVWGPSQLIVNVPAGASSAGVAVVVGGVQSNSKAFTVVPAPSITSVSPSPTSVGTTITIQGSNLTAGGAVKPQTWFYGPSCQYSQGITDFGNNTSTNTSVVTTVPSGAFSGNVSVAVDGVNSNALSLGISALPQANAGPAQTVAVGALVQLDGTRSQNLSGSRITHNWSFVNKPTGSTATLNSSILPNPTFVADKAGSYLVQLIINNGQKYSAASTVAISTQNSAPVANAGFNDNVNTGIVRLNGSGSTDVDGNALSYNWSLVSVPAGSTAKIAQPTAANTSFTADLSGNYVAQLIVNDGQSSSAPATVTKSTVNIPFVTANAGPAETITVPQTVQLDGGGSTGRGSQMLSYSWSILYAPPGSAATLSSTSFPKPTFQADLAGTYVVQLIVNNCGMNSVSTVAISTGDVPPVAQPGAVQAIAVGSTVDLTGDASTASGDNALIYRWSLLNKPTGSAAALSSTTSEFPLFVVDLAGDYISQLIVNDGTLNSAPSTKWDSTLGHLPPVADAGSNQTVAVSSTVQLSGANSFSPDGESVGYGWIMLSKPSGSNATLFRNISADATFVADVAGLYIVQLTVHNSTYGSSVPVTVEITAAQNQAPVVNAGPNQTITLPVNQVTLLGTATDDGLPNGTLAITWSVVSGLGTVSFYNPNEASTQASFSSAGTYVLKLTANDSQLQSSATTTVTVNPPLDQPPVVNAGPNQTITLPANVVTLNGSATDGGLPLTTSWTMASGPAPVLFANSTMPVTTAMFTIAGLYTLQLSASNGQTSASATTTVTVNPQANTPPSGSIVLSPSSAGPILTATVQQVQATVTNNTGGGITNQLVSFAVTGPNQTSGTATTNSSGVATFSYTGTKAGVDAVVATATLGVLPLTSNTSMISWVVQSPAITASTVQGEFFTSDGSGTFDTSSSAQPAFTQTFASINFNPPTGSIPGMPNTIGVTTVPFTNVTTDANGNYTGSVIAQGNGLQAGAGTLSTFQAVLTGTFTVAAAGNVTFNFLNSDGFVFGISGASRVSGSYVDPPTSTAFHGYPVMGAFDTVTAPVANTVTVNFPAAGSYPYEVDYADSNQASLIPPGSTWKYQIANPTLGNITSISRTGGVVTISVNQPLSNFVAGTQVTISGVTDSVDFPNATETVALVESDGNENTTFTVNWAGANASSSGGTLSEEFTLPFYLVGFNDSSFSLGQAPFTNTVGEVDSQNCPLIGKTYFPVDGILDLRKLITLPPGATNVQALVAIDNDFTLWVNGTQVINQIHENCASEWNYTVAIPDNLWVSGTNLIAVQARDRGFETGFEFALVGPSSLVSPKPQTLVMSTNSNNGQSSLTMAPGANFTQILGQPTTFTALVTNVSGAPASNIPVTFNVAGVNPQQFTVTTGSAGTAVFTYEGFFAGTDIVQASAQFGTTPLVSTQTQVAWTYQTNLPQLGTLLLSPSNTQNQTVGNTQTFTVEALNGSGQPVANVPVTLIVSLANTQLVTGTTNSSGIATLGYVGVTAGMDTVEADANINGNAAFSNLVTVNWAAGSGGGSLFSPQGWILSPLIGAVVQSQVPIMLESGETLTSGTLTFYPVSNKSQVTVLNPNTTGTGPLSLGIFDATLLANGEYVVQLQAIDSTGVARLSEIVLSVVGNNKPGREVVNVTDFKIPLAGIPVSISRTYDSLNRGTVQDFGNGWEFGASVNLQVDLKMDVTFTLNGNPQTFYFTPQSSGSIFYPWLMVPHYTPQPGFHGTLTSNGCGILIYSGGVLLQDSSGIVCYPSGVYMPTTYTYTDAAGRVYTIACGNNCNTNPPVFQLQTIRDLNGNTLAFTPNGITSSVGGGTVVVPFVRDSQNRITKITDLNGNSYLYNYDTPCGTGDLCSVTYPGITTPAIYTYYSSPALLNLLDTFTDPMGNETVNTYYPASDPNQGRLQSVTGPPVTGANGQTKYVTQYSYNVPTNTTTTINPDNGVVVQTNDNFGNPLVITDALGRTTTYTYDTNENLISKTDALNNTTTYTYDANGNQTSVTDPLGDISTTFYNQYSEVTAATDAAKQNTTNYGYDSNFNLNLVTDTLGQTYAATYDKMGDPVTQTDANGNTTQFSYDTKGNLLKVVDPLNEVTAFTYDAMDRVLTRTDPRQNQTVNTYDGLGNLTVVADPLGHVSRATYDFNGNKTADIDALGVTTSYTYDALNRLVKTTYPDSTTKTDIYDFRNNKLSEIDQSGRTTQYLYDLAGELQSVTYALGTADAGTVQYTYYANGLKETVIDENNNPTTNFYDAANRLTSVKDAQNNSTQYGYDADNRLTSKIDARKNKTSYTPDARSRVITVTYPDTTTDQYGYDGVGNRKKKTDQALNVTQWGYDQVNRLTSVTDANSPAGNTKYAYDPAGNLITITDANSHVTTFQYDGANRKILRALPLNQQETYFYDADNNLTAKTDFNLNTTSYTYDTLHRLLTKVPASSLSEPTITFTYYPTGTRQSMVDATGTTNYTYDNRNRLKIKATPEGTLNYTYDAHGNVLTIASSNANGALVAYTPDPLNRLSTVTDNRLAAQGVTSPVTTYGYDLAGNMSGYSYSANGLQSTYNYDTLNRLSLVSWAKGATSLSSFTYTPFPAGNVKTVAELSGRSVAYGYDNDYHLQSETIASDPGGNNGAETYTYDAVGNRKTINSTIPSLAGANSYTYDANDRLSIDTYDNDGNTIASFGITDTYDFENHMLTHGAVTMTYDGDGIRVSETAGGVTTKYLVDTLNPTGYSQVVDEVVSGAVTKTYTYGLRLISENQVSGSTWTPTFYGYDGHGNVRFLTNTAAAVVNTYTLDAYGVQIASTVTTANTYLYSGERFDSNLNLYQLRARFYNMLTGRFETMDPAAGNISDPGTLHRYAYSRSNPVNLVDPTGRDFEEQALTFQEVDLTATPGARKIAWGTAQAFCSTVTAFNVGYYIGSFIATGGSGSYGPPGWPPDWKAFCGLVNLAGLL